jgi:cephalosporin hydroxylase
MINADKIEEMDRDIGLREQAHALFLSASTYRYPYNFTWLGRPIIQLPEDIVIVQELIWRVQPDLIVETGIAHGGSLMLSASLLEMLGGDGRVVGIDREIRPHNRQAIEAHPLFKRITMIEGSSIDDTVVRQVKEEALGRERVMVLLDSSHTHAHVLRELELYTPMVRAGSYVIVFDTVVDDMPDHFFAERPWGRGDNPKTAVREFLKQTDRFELDREVEKKLLFTCCPEGFLRCVRDP